MEKDIADLNKANEAIEKIHEFQRFGSILGLERMTSLLNELGNPQEELKVIHVAGTNGKGSICKYIYSILKEGGYKVGLYTSPFLEIFNERIELDGQYISDSDLALYTDRVMKAVNKITERGEQSPTEFEVITAIAFLYFKEKGTDYVVLEVGLGGRGDSTNVCKVPLATVIASISYDHTDRLGKTLTEIAGEKAGIIKEGCPVITSAESDEALTVIEETAAKKSAMYFETRNIPYTIKKSSLNGYEFDTIIQGVEFNDVEISMVGEHQIKNAIAALATLATIEERGQVVLKREDVYAGIKKAKMIGRLEVMRQEKGKPTVIIDGAHNPDGAKNLANAIETFCGGKKTLMVTGMLADKETDKIIKEFLRITHTFIATEPLNPRKMDCRELKKQIESFGGRCDAIMDYSEACKEGLKTAEGENYDVLLFAGSLYLIGAIRSILKNINKE